MSVALVPDYYSLLKSVSDQRPRILAGALIPERAMIEDFCLLLKAENPQIPVILYAEEVAEEERLALMELGADEVVSSREAPAVVAEYLRLLNEHDVEPPPVLLLTPVARQRAYQSYMPFDGSDLSSVLQFIAMSRRHGVVEIQFDDATMPAGRVYTVNGRLVHAEYESAAGIRALAQLMRKGAGHAGFIPETSPPTESIHMPLEHALMEAAVLADEESTDGGA